MSWKELGSHQLRLITGFGLAIPLFALVGLGPLWSWALLITLMSSLALWEFEALMFAEPLQIWERGLYYLMGLCMPGFAFVAAASGLHVCLVLGVFLGLTGILVSAPNDSAGLARIANMIFGWLYIPYLLSYVLLIGRSEQARQWVFFLLFVTMAGDAGAYYCGRKFGAHKLYERVSPKKTLEGSVGGFVCSLAVGGLCGAALIQGVPLIHVLLVSAAISLTGQVGDLFESMIKRMCGKKDSSHILPGHGGILDRLDSLLFVFPLVWAVAS
ncbi:MAG: phosphatidate cytidylyltransferase [Syntrophobacteraceae bacterium]|nr:phosphatidate cytidylyltransferase [Syntrophobacteraceae bacterium]